MSPLAVIPRSGHLSRVVAVFVFLSVAVVAQAQPGAAVARVPLEAYRESPAGALARRISLDLRQTPREEVLRAVGRQAGLVLVFNTDLVAAAVPADVTARDEPAVEVLYRLLTGWQLRGFVLPDGKILVTHPDDPAPAAPQRPGSAPAPDGQTVRGRVVDGDIETPLPGASIVVVGSDPLLGTATDVDGRFVLPGVPLGRHDLQVSFVGYEPVVLRAVLVTSGKEVVLEARLKEQVVEGAEIVVVPGLRKDQPLNDMAGVSARSFTVEETRRYAGGLDDPARMAAAFAGVTGAAGLGDNALVVRGNAPKGVLWRLEGVEIPNPNHFAGLTMAGGGGLTLFSGQLLTDSDFLSGAFPAEYGNALAGVFDMNFRSGNPEQREHTFQASVLGLDVASEGPFVRGSPSTYLFNYRYSTLALLMPLLPTDSDVIRYQDLSFKLSFPTRRAGRFEAWGIGGLDSQDMHEEPDSARWESEQWDRLRLGLRLGVGAAGVTHTLPVGRRSYLRTHAAVTYNQTRIRQRRLSDDLVLEDNLQSRTTDARLIGGAYLNHKSGARHVNRTGFAVQQIVSEVTVLAAPGDVPPLAALVWGQDGSTLLQAYTQSKLDVSPRLTLNAGLHAQHFALTGRTSVEPRASLRWQVDARQAFGLGYGLHSRIEDLRLHFVTLPDGSTPNRRLGFTRAHHAVAGYDRTLGPAARAKVEAYYQYLFDVPVIPDSSFSMLNWEQDWLFDERLVNTGAGKNYGVELTLERFFQDGYYYLLSGSVYTSRYRGGDGVWRRTRYDQGYAANALFGKEFALGSRSHLLGLNGRVMLMGGRRRSPVDEAASLDRQEVVYDLARAFTVKAPGVFVADLTLTYRLNRRRFAETWALQVKNVLAAKDTYLDYNFKSNRVEEVAEGYPVPVLSYKIEF